MKRIFKLSLVFFLSLFLVACDRVYFPFFDIFTETQTTTLRTSIDGTITFEESEYNSFEIYDSLTYKLDDIDEYNDILLSTKNHIRHANIQVNTVLYNPLLPWGGGIERDVLSMGSGFIFHEDDDFYYAITNNHVVESEFDVDYEIKTFEDTEFHSAELLVTSEEYDLAVLKFSKNSRSEVSIIDIYQRLYYKFNVGEIVLAVGNPSTVVNNVTFGEFKSMENLENVGFKVIYHDATIANGSSGGALVDIDGNLLGVNAWGLEDSDEFSFAIPNYIVYTFLINNGILD
ncbi:MAG: hypothetical protein CVV60_02630 [Tenericutes bacterium HGW-Tenericutes-5]|nr:MAG: hypothetical protein CVV60_02630 [Tenericutes bacterium HGW-Tenericutes-5]